jgi:SNF2 family DNA or RNA helicase
MKFTHELLDLTRALDDADVEEDTVDGSQIPPLTRYREITQAERDAYREQAQWLDNKEYQRDNHLEACRNLGIEDPERPRIEGLYPARTLEFYQPTAINAIVEFEDSALKGGLLADDMGIGKTVEIIGLLLHRSNQRRSAIANGDPVDPALPTLILMPRTLITQWRDEILRFTDRFRIVVYYGASKKHAQGRVIHPRGKLDQSSEFFGGAEINADTIILSTYSTWASRHGPKTQIDWLIRDFMQSNGVSRNAAKEHINRTHTKNVATKRCAIQLQGCFERVILDEGHEIRHMSPQVGTAVRWVGGKYRVVVTGTPILNGLVDICGIMRFLQPPELESEEYLRTLGLEARGNDALQKTLESFNPWAVDDDDPRAILRFTTAALDEWVFNSRTTTEQRAIRMRAVFEACMIRRSLSSTIGDKRIGDSLPEVQRINIQCEFTDVERRYYDYLYADTSSQLFKKSKSGEELSWNTTTYRKLCLITSWLGMGWLLEYKATKLKKIREHRDNPVKFLRDVRAGQARAKIPVAAQIQVPQKEDRVQLIRMHCTGSPKLRQLLSIIAELVVLQKEKVTVWVNSPFQMEWLDCVGTCSHRL